MMLTDYKVSSHSVLKNKKVVFLPFTSHAPLGVLRKPSVFWKDENAVQRFSFILLQEFRPQLGKSWMNSAYFALGGAQRLFSR